MITSQELCVHQEDSVQSHRHGSATCPWETTETVPAQGACTHKTEVKTPNRFFITESALLIFLVATTGKTW